MTATWSMVNSSFKEERWVRMMALSFCFHLVIFSTFLFTPQTNTHFPSIEEGVYHVELVGPPSGVESGVKGKSSANIAKRKEKPHIVKTKTRRIAVKKKKTVSVLAKRVSSKPIARERKKDFSASELVDRAISKIEKKVKEKKTDDLEKALSQIERKVKNDKTSQSEKALDKPEGGIKTVSKGGKGGIFGMSSGIGKGIQLYQMKIEDAIKNNWSYPVALIDIKSKKPPEAIIIVTVRSDGKILKAWFRKKSNNPLFDDSVLKAIERSDPLPKFPPGYLKSYDEVEINFSLKDLIQQ
ncbi:MAG: TonB C-terminal domain-containing protein [Candidatus Omnitrophica bacterium]|nr:TonB C-terminal domain-containing protein [Candidatus Omnitrophota bacterium]